MELRQYAAIAWRWSWLLILGAVLAGAAAFLASRAQTPVYEAKATVLVNQAQAVTGPTFSDVQANQQLTKTYGQIVTSGPVLEQVAEQSDLTFDELRKKVSGSARRDTQLIDITVRDTDPERATRLANLASDAFAQEVQAAQTGRQTAAEQELVLQAAVLREAVGERQQRIAQLNVAQPGPPDPQRAAELAAVTSQLETLRQNLARVEDNLQGLRIERVKHVNSVTPINPARAPTEPVSPRVLFNTVLALMVGLIVAAGIVAVVEYLDDTVKTAADVSRVAGLVTLGTIQRFKQPERSKGGRPDGGGEALPPVAAPDTQSPTAEAYRMVRTNLEFARGGRRNQTLLVTSALPGEGKSTTSANLAIAQAQTGRRVLLVDADMRRPSIHRMFGIPNATGLSTLFVMEQPAPAGLLRPTALESLVVLPTGPLPPNPAELLSSERMAEIIELLKAQADVVIFDSPPLLSVADALSLAARLDGVVLVVDAGRTRSGMLARATELLMQAQARIFGVVLNRVKVGRGDGYYYYYGSNRRRAEDGAEDVPPAGARAAFTLEPGAQNGAGARRSSYAKEPKV
jgi:capsular exopolysaccharide synthesis family protein